MFVISVLLSSGEVTRTVKVIWAVPVGADRKEISTCSGLPGVTLAFAVELFETKEVLAGMQYLFQTKGDVYPLAASGTGALESAVVNLLSPGDKAIAVVGGKFGQRWQQLLETYKIDVIPLSVEWGKAVDPQDIKKLLDDNKDVKAVYTTLCETSTAVVQDTKEIAKIVAATDAPRRIANFIKVIQI